MIKWIILILLFLFGDWKLRLIMIGIVALLIWITHWRPQFDEKAFHLYFGLPGCGKTTALCYMYLKLRKAVDVFSNVDLPGAYKLHRSDFGRYDLHVEKENSIVLQDEASVHYFKRDFAKFNSEENSFHSMHRHYHVMECFFCQTWDGIDQRLRELNSHLFYVYNKDYPIIGKVIFIRQIRKAFNIFDGDPKDSYEFKPFSTRWFLAKPVFKYFNTYDAPPLEPKKWQQYEKF